MGQPRHVITGFPGAMAVLPGVIAVLPGVIAVLLGAALLAAGCTSSDVSDRPSTEIPDLVVGQAVDYGIPPDVPTGPVGPELAELLDAFDSSFSLGLSTLTTGFEPEQLQRMVDLGDARILWVLADLLRFPVDGRVTSEDVVAAFEALSGASIGGDGNPWTNASNLLIAWDLPAFDGYLEVKRALFTTLEPKWEPFFDEAADIEWRHVGWGGVLIDDRVLGNGDACERGCIPALDDPATTNAAGGAWYPDDALVFGIEIDGEARAYPKNMLEVHEMVNDTLGGRRIAVPYCTLCGSAQAYLTDESITMRTSGLLIRSNKMMFELGTMSLVDTFLGVGTSGPLQGRRFEQVSVATSTWGAWKAEHPDTTILAEDGGIGRSYADDPLRGRDDDGPIFPVGAVDDRLPAQQSVLGVETDDGRPIAVHVDIARATLQSGTPIVIADLTIELAGDGIRAVRADGTDAGGHEAFWFAWSQFQPTTLVWPIDAG